MLLQKEMNVTVWISTHVGYDGEVRQGFQYVEPDADVLGSLGHRSAVLAHKLVGVQTDFHPVIEERKEGSEGEGCHEDGDETKLEHCSTRSHFICSMETWSARPTAVT